MRHRLFLCKVLLLVAAIRLMLWALPFGRVQQIVQRWGRRTARLEKLAARRPATLARAVAVASRYVPAATCLPQALAAQVLLSRGGYAPRLHIGVKTSDAGGLQAHAWLDAGGEVVIGGGALEQYVVLGRQPNPIGADRT